jgi:predicted Rdx family selenoprotein
VSAEIKQQTGIDALLIPGGGGIFDIKQDGVLVFSKHKLARFPEPGEIAGLLAD